MSQVAELVEKVRGQIAALNKGIRTRIFGANNERLDLVMDSFNKLSPPQQASVVVGIGAGLFLIVVLGIALYFTSVGALKSDLEQSFAALHEFQTRRAEFQRVDARFSRVVEQVTSRTQGVAMKPLFERISKDLGVNMEDLRESKQPMPAENPFSKRLQEQKVELRLPNVSVPRILNFLIEVEKANHFLRIRDLQVDGRFGTRLYFDGRVTVRGYAPGGG